MRRKAYFIVFVILVFAAGCHNLYAQTGTEAWTRIGIAFSGNINAVAVSQNYQSDGTLYAGVEGGGLWKSVNRGVDWTQCPAVPGSYSVTGIALPAGGSIVCVATREGYFYRSNDGGATVAANGSYQFINPNNDAPLPLTSIVAHNVSPYPVYVSTWGRGVYKHVSGGIGSGWTYIGPDQMNLCYSLTITSSGTVWGGFFRDGGNALKRYSGTSATWYSPGVSYPISQDITAIRASWLNSAHMWAGTADNGMWLSTDSGETWTAACDGTSTGGAGFIVRAIRESPLEYELWEGRSNGLRTSTDLGVNCADGFTGENIKCVEFAPGFDSGSAYCEAFVGTAKALYRVPCAGTTKVRSPKPVDGKVVALSHDGKQFFMGSIAGGLYKCLQDGKMVQYNNFPNGQTPEIVAICLHPSYNEFEECGDATTLFVAANFPLSPLDNGVYKSVDAANSWVKMDQGDDWPVGTPLYMRDLAISPSYSTTGEDHTLFVATDQYLFRWDGAYWTACDGTSAPTDIDWVALPPAFNSNYNCNNSSIAGYPCKMVWVGAKSGGAHARLYYSYDLGLSFTFLDLPLFCSNYPDYCPTDVTGIAFPKDFGLDDGTTNHKVYVSSSTKGVLRSAQTTPQWVLWNTHNTGLPASLNVVDITADPDWVNGDGISYNAILLCAVAPNSGNPAVGGIYRALNASGTLSWSQVIPGHGLSVAYETRWQSATSHTKTMAGLAPDAAVSTTNWGAYYMNIPDENLPTPSAFTKYYSLPDDVFATVAHERDPNYVFATSPSMGVFVSKNKGETFNPWNTGAGGTAGPCYLTNGYGITMLAHRRGTNLDTFWVGTRDGIKIRHTYTDTSGKVHLDYEGEATTPPPSVWKHSYLANLTTPTSGYWERMESVAGSGAAYPVWAASPLRSGFTGDEQGFASLAAGTSDGWTIQTSGLASTNSTGVRIGYDGGSDTKTITNGQVITGSVKDGAWDYYRVNVTSSPDDLQVLMDDLDDGGSQNPDLYVRYSSQPSESTYDYRPYVNGDEQVCVTRFYDQVFGKAWGPYGDNPPTGWTITKPAGDATWDTNNWHAASGTNLPKVVGDSSKTMDEWLISPAFDIPANTDPSMEVMIYHRFVRPVFGTATAHGYTKIRSTEAPAWYTIGDRYTYQVEAGYQSYEIPSSYKGHHNVQVAFNYYDASSTSSKSWQITSVQVGGLLTGYWYIGIRGNASVTSEYSLTTALNSGCTQSFANLGEPNKEPATGVRFSAPDPLAPVSSATWGTVGLEGVVRGTGTVSFNFEERNGTVCPLGNLATQTIIQLPDLTLITGCDPSGGDDCIWYSPAPDEGVTCWLPADGIASEGSKDYVDILQASNGDVLIACEGTGTESDAGGVWLSGDLGRNWMRISQGFDSTSQALSDIVADAATPPSYYVSTDQTGLWTRTVTASLYPDVTGISPTNGPGTGGTLVTITGSNFSNSCPTENADDCPDATPVVIFGETEVAGTWVSATSVQAYSPAHEAGLVSVKVRNPDTRISAAGMGYTFNFVCQDPSGMANNLAEDADPCADTGVTVEWSAPSDWGDGGTGTRTYDVLRDGAAVTTGLSEATLSYGDTAGVNGTSYTYSVRANNGCDESYTTAGTSATDSVPSAPSWTFNNTASDLDGCADTGVRIQWNGPSAWGDGGSGTRTYDVLRDGSAIATGLSSSTSSYTDATGVNGTTYAYKVKANNGCSLSAETTGATGVDNVGSAPSGMANNTAADVDACADSGVKIDWNDPSSWGDNGSGTRSFVVYRGASAIQTLSSSIHTYTDTAGTNGTSYLYRVRAVNGCSLLTLTTGANATDTVGAAPSGFSNNTAADIDACADSGVKIDWTAPSDWGDNGYGTRSFEVLRNGASIAAGLSSATLTYTDTTGTNGTSYTYTVRAANGCSLTTLTTGASASDETGPGAPSITNISDNDACSQSGIKVAYTAGSGATSHDLYRDGVSVVTGYSSGAAYNPGDTSSHSYVVRAIKGSCYANSSSSAFADANDTPGIPTITGVTDEDPCLQNGVRVNFGGGSGAERFDLYIDGDLAVTGYTTGTLYDPQTTAAVPYMIRAVTGTCYSNSSSVEGTDVQGAPGEAVITAVTDMDTCYQNGITVTYTPGSGASSHDLYRDGVSVVTGYLSGAAYDPQDTDSHNYRVRAVAGSCYSVSALMAGTDENNGPGKAVITGVTDEDLCAQSGVRVVFTAGSGAISHDLYRDGSLAVEGYSSGALYDPQDTSSHNYRIREYDGSCYSVSELMAGTDVNAGIAAPSAPAVDDDDPCATSGVTVTWSPVPRATGYDIRIDGTATYEDVTSPYSYNPGDSSSHNFKVRAKDMTTLCVSDWSVVTAAADVNNTPSAPSVVSITDLNAGALDGVVIVFNTGSPATAHDLYMDSVLVVTNFTSGGVFIPGDSGVHSFVVRALNGGCFADSAPAAGQDLLVALPPEIAPGDTYETAQTWSLDKATQYWPGAAEADGYRLYRIRKSDLGNLQNAVEEGCIRDLGSAVSYDCTGDDPSSLPNGIYYYLVTGYNEAGEGSAGEGTGFTRNLSSTNTCN